MNTVVRPDIDVFWGEIAPCSHMVQLYEDVEVLIDSLEGFIGAGLEAGDAAVVIATPVHIMLLDARLEARGIDVTAARETDQYIALDAEQTLKTFLIGGWPDADRFEQQVRRIVDRARGAGGRKVRAFGEMVAVMWAQGHHGAVVRLEHLWQALCQRTADMTLFCAYPKSGITQDAHSALAEIFRAHTRVVDGAASRH
jgi:hypothetical protein